MKILWFNVVCEIEGRWSVLDVVYVIRVLSKFLEERVEILESVLRFLDRFWVIRSFMDEILDKWGKFMIVLKYV